MDLSISSLSLTSPDWAHLEADILGTILDKLVPHSDFIRFSAVCKPWNSVASSLKHKQKRMDLTNHQLPWQLVVTLDQNGKERISLYDFGAARLSSFKLRIPDSFSLISCHGSSHGWLFFSESLTSSVVLNPLSGTLFRLPPVCKKTFSGCDELHLVPGLSLFDQAVLSKDPSSAGSFEIVAVNLFQNVVAHLNLGDGEEVWSYTVKKRNNEVDFKTVGFYNDRMLALCDDGIVSLEKINSGGGGSGRGGRKKFSLDIKKVCGELDPKLRKIYASSKGGFCLVQSTKGYLLMVCQIGDDRHVYKIVEVNGRFDHIPMANLDGHSLFVGKNHPVLVLASNYTAVFRPNSIYFSTAPAREPWLPPSEDTLKYVFRIQEFSFDDGSERCFSTVKTSTNYQNILLLAGGVPWIVPSLKF